MTEGYNRDWTNWDAYVQHLWPKPADVRYRNWYPFLSPKGRWMAFYNKSYTDINIIDLETKELVVRDFYSRYRGYDQIEDKRVPRPDHVYNGGHCNVSTYVPSYSYTQFKSTHEEGRWICSELEDHDFDEFDPKKADEYFLNKGSNYIHAKETRTLASVPLAFNAYTFWAADVELYVDLIDLSLVDDGIIKMIDGGAFIIPHGAEHVRNYVNCSFSGEDDPDKSFTMNMSFSVLKEEEPLEFGFNKQVNRNALEVYDGKWCPANNKELLPWQEVQKRQKEYKLKKKEKTND